MAPQFEAVEVSISTSREPRRLVVSWKRENSEFTATLVRKGNVAVSESLEVRRPTGVTSDDRRLPGDAAIVGAVLRKGSYERSLILWLLEESLWVPDLKAVEDEVVDKSLRVFAEAIHRRSRSDRSNLIDEIRRMDAEGVPKSDMVSHLTTTGGVSRSTAYRLIDAAREEGVHE